MEKILSHKFDDLPILTEMLYRAALQYSECHFADALILGWTVCERLLNASWDEFLLDNKNSIEADTRIDSDRMQKLRGRDFTASIILENLELAGRIPIKLFKEIDGVRKARNGRLHKLKAVTDREAVSAIRVAQEFLTLFTGIPVTFTLSRNMPGTGGIPSAIYERIKRQAY
jgi:hypothetical protein